MRDVIENGPGLDVVPKVLDLVVVDSVEEEGERLEVHQGGHHPVDAEDLGTRVARYLGYSGSKHGNPTCSVPFFLRMKIQKQPERKKRTDIRMYRAGKGISPAL